jgi:hypothetical protein
MRPMHENSDAIAALNAAARAGVDLSLLEANLRFTHEQRALQHQAALDLALELQHIGERLRGGPQSASTAAG